VLHGDNIEFMRWAKFNVPINVTVTLDIRNTKQAEKRRNFCTEITYRQEGHLVTS
jgi:hypothetical protein